MGFGGASPGGGTTMGTIPKAAYLARISATRAATGIAGYGILISITSISALKSSPVTVRVDWPASLLGETSCLVITPSIKTRGSPFIVAMITTRVIIGSK